MSTQITIKNFEQIYNETYNKTLKYIICKCQNLEDVNELIQETYIELYKTLKNKNKIKVEKEISYIIGIAKNKINQYYRQKYKEQSNIIYIEEPTIPINSDLEVDIINKENVEQIWNYLNKKDVLIAKIFYLYYALGLKIAEIAEELNLKESNIKNHIYRTLKELSKIYGKEKNSDE